MRPDNPDSPLGRVAGTKADCPYTRKHYTSGNMQSVQGICSAQSIRSASVRSAERTSSRV
jgi:hypothetical protein